MNKKTKTLIDSVTEYITDSELMNFDEFRCENARHDWYERVMGCPLTEAQCDDVVDFIERGGPVAHALTIRLALLDDKDNNHIYSEATKLRLAAGLLKYPKLTNSTIHRIRDGEA